MNATRGRLVYANQVVQDQADLFQVDGYTRVTGLTISDLVGTVFFNSTVLSWPLTSGTGVTDPQISAGSVYFHTISAGYYAIRFRPNAVGYWRVEIKYPTGTQVLDQDYDVTMPPSTGPTGSGLKSSFVGSGETP